ncbi:helix-turn-helix transcriptional regulator [Marinobacterium stanieri]|uniref:Predicted DNA-binding transcriptional regulator YafY, contains an HTH and WYL domains n=1 Tax=Marinobacterium stanieri TaxID=49186 RepID=A0A1N6R375_9GAMM|nr:YafY family protein [Marinobacterium stanieri]SIQ23122.1 Predicted DNA-binding transcriptional regulator YafY, contains an HTH and WYL domains [Marinobacterium stanieri]
MSRTERLLDILQILRRHRRPVRGAVLAEETGISLRTLYRDIATLQSMGAEIDGEPGLGYVLKPGFLLPPLMFSPEEIEALALGLKWAGTRTDGPLGQAARDAMAKLGAVLPDELRRRFDDDGLVVVPCGPQPEREDLPLIRKALSDECKLLLDYSDQKGAKTQRIVWPVTVGFFDSVQVLAAWCELRDDYRHFRIDRIQGAQLLTEKTPRRRSQMMKEWRKTLLTETDSGGQ